MKPPGHGGRAVRDMVDDEPLRAGITGIALVALATLGLALAGAVIVALALLLTG